MVKQIDPEVLLKDVKYVWDPGAQVLGAAAQAAYGLHIDAYAFGNLPLSASIAEAYLDIDDKVYLLLKEGKGVFGDLSRKLVEISNRAFVTEETNSKVVCDAGKD